MTQPEGSTEAFPVGPVIPLFYQYNLLCDEKRLINLKTAIESMVGQQDVVADLGSGVGILTYLAAQTADHVHAIELDKSVFEIGKKELNKEGLDNISVYNGDVRNISLPESVDVVICEMLDTALITELEVPVMNYAIEEFLHENGRTIPHRAKTTIQLVESDYKFLGKSFRLPHYEAYGSRESIPRSKEIEYHNICFEERNETRISEDIEITTTKSGMVNGIQVRTYTQFSEDQKYIGPTDWLNPPLVLPTQEDLQMNKGDEFEISLQYVLGGGFDKLNYDIQTI